MIPADLALLAVPGPAVPVPGTRSAVVSVVQPDLAQDEYTGQLWLVDLDGAHEPRRLTRGHRDTSPDVSPDGRWVAFLRAEPQGRPQVWLVASGGGEPVRLTQVPLGAGAPRFSPDGTRLAFVAREAQEGRYAPDVDASAEAPRLVTELQYRSDGLGYSRDRRRRVMVVDLPQDPTAPGAQPLDATALTPVDLDVDGVRWLPGSDGLVAVTSRHASRESDLRCDAVRVDLAGGDVAPLTDADAGSPLGVATVLVTAGATWLLAQDLGPDGTEFVAAQVGLYRVDAAGARRLTDAEELDLVPGILVAAGEDVLVADEHRGSVRLLRVSPDGSVRVLLDGPVVVSAVTVTDDGRTAVVTVARPDSSGDVVAVDLATGAAVTVTDLSAPLRATGRTRVPTALSATSADGYPVHGWVARPDAERFPAPHPTILMIHGGPFAQYTHALFDEVQTLVAAGYAVVLGNPRGSAGFGHAHGAAIRGRFGSVDADDLLALLDEALRAPDLDGGRTGVMGGSYGGYMTAWLTTQTHRFRAAIVERGFLDPVSFVGSSDIGWFFGLRYLSDGTPDGDPAQVAAQSPMAHVREVRTPTLVIHSEQDWRCPVEQGQRWFTELRLRGVPSQLLLFPGEGHELSRSGRPRHREARFEHVLRWWSTYLPVTSTAGTDEV